MQAKTDCGQDILAYLKRLPEDLLNVLYESSATCLAICRYLPELTHQIILRLLFVENPVSIKVVCSWFLPRFQSEANEAVSNMKSLGITANCDNDDVILSAIFRKGLKEALFSGRSNLTRVDVNEKYKKSVSDLEQYALKQWECVLRYLALPSTESENAVSAATRSVLQNAGYVRGGSDCRLEITSRGFQYLLLDRRSQLWSYLLSYLQYLESNRSDIVEPISFLFQLSFCALGQAYSSEQLSESMLDFLQHLREIGLVCQRKRTAGFYYPTPLALSLAIGKACDASLMSSELMKSKGFIVVETNFRVYSYTDSVLQLAIVSTFTDMLYRFSNMSVGVLTRESVRRALQVGITANQIIDYLKSNAHDQMLKQPLIVPPTISDQIRLWELERDRFIFDEGVLYSNFASDEEYTSLRNYARQIDALMWESANGRMIVVTPSGHDNIKQWKSQRGL